MADTEHALSGLYHAFRAHRRRAVVQILRDENGTTLTTRELARKISSIERKVPKQRATGEPYRNVYNALSQTHLPTLAEAGIIIYDPDRQTIHRGSYFDVAALLLDINTPTVGLFYSILDTDEEDKDE